MIEGFIYTLRFIYALHFSINFGVYDLSLQAVLAITIYSFRILLLICDDGWCLTSFCIHNDSTYYIGNIPLGVHVVSFPDTTTKGYIHLETLVPILSSASSAIMTLWLFTSIRFVLARKHSSVPMARSTWHFLSLGVGCGKARDYLLDCEATLYRRCNTRLVCPILNVLSCMGWWIFNIHHPNFYV